MKTVAVFFGGNSNEREISVITGMFCVNLLRESYRVLPVYLPPEGGFLLGEGLRGVEDFRSGAEKVRQKKFAAVELVRGGLRRKRKFLPVDCALNCCHGGAGEGGVLSAMLEFFAVPLASPGMTASAVFLDKSLGKIALRGLGVPVLPSFTVREERFAEGAWRRQAEELGYPVIVKPCKLGSSVGISVAEDEAALEKALAFSFRLDGAALVERYLAGKRDLNLAAYRTADGLALSPVEEVFSGSPILTFGEKYRSEGTRASQIPAAIPKETEERMRRMLTCVYEQFGMNGVVRADFLLSPEGEVYFNELNTVPGTLAVYLFGEGLLSARNMLMALIGAELSRPRKERTVVSSGILESAVFGGKSRKLR